MYIKHNIVELLFTVQIIYGAHHSGYITVFSYNQSTCSEMQTAEYKTVKVKFHLQ